MARMLALNGNDELLCTVGFRDGPATALLSPSISQPFTAQGQELGRRHVEGGAMEVTLAVQMAPLVRVVCHRAFGLEAIAAGSQPGG